MAFELVHLREYSVIMLISILNRKNSFDVELFHI